MCNGTILLAYAKAHQRELWQQAEMHRQAQIARARTPQQHAGGMPFFTQFLRMWGFDIQAIEEPTTTRATA